MKEAIVPDGIKSFSKIHKTYINFSSRFLMHISIKFFRVKMWSDVLWCSIKPIWEELIILLSMKYVFSLLFRTRSNTRQLKTHIGLLFSGFILSPDLWMGEMTLLHLIKGTHPLSRQRFNNLRNAPFIRGKFVLIISFEIWSRPVALPFLSFLIHLFNSVSEIGAFSDLFALCAWGCEFAGIFDGDLLQLFWNSLV